MSRPDGRVQPGQRLDSAFSARAWNRAQDAADLVLGDRGGLTVPRAGKQTGQLILPCTVSTIYNNVTIGHAVQIISCSAVGPVLNTNVKNPPDDFTVPQNFILFGEVLRAKTFSALSNSGSLFGELRTAASIAIGVIVGGPVMPTPSQGATVDICVRGPCVVRVRNRSSHVGSRFLRPAFVQRPTDTAENLHGCLEQADEGQAHAIASLSNSYSLVGGQLVPNIAQYGSDPNPANRTDIIWYLAML